jgi:predicted nucleotide-binding protein (sugar kinase/HSP70/actin superfamily)
MVAKSAERNGGKSLQGRTLYIPQMAYAGSRLMAACFRSVGVEAAPAPDSDARTLELGGLHSSGEECLPHKITLGDFLKVCRRPGFDPAKTAFLMPTAHGPCRFGQYGPYLRMQLEELGYGEAMVFSPTSANGYRDLGQAAGELIPTLWLSVVCGDIAQKLLLKTRPYELRAGDSDEAFHQAVEAFAEVLAMPGLKPGRRLAKLVELVVRVRDRFRAIPATYVQGRPLVGLVGEIFCRLNTFSNDDLARRVEALGGECWISDIAEWVWYVNWYVMDNTVREKGRFNLDCLKQWVKNKVQQRYEKALLAPLSEDFKGYEEPHDIRDVLHASEPYLPSRGSIGEMVLNAGKAVYLYEKGADGVIDISPFTCMNGIICEAVYPSVSKACDGIPIRIFYFDGTQTSLDRDLEIFLDLTRAYQHRKKHPRSYPDNFEK